MTGGADPVDLVRGVLFGLATLALLAGLVALASAKGGDAHRAAGRLFAGLMLPVCAAVLGVAAWDDDAFMALVTTFSAYLVWSGRREVTRHREGTGVDLLRDLGPVGGLVGAGVALVAAGARAARAEDGVGTYVVAAGFGLLLVFLAVMEALRLRRAPEPDAWLRQHVGAMGVALVVVTTVLGALTRGLWGLPDWVPWLAPTVVGLLVVPRWLWQVRRLGEKATFL